VPHSVEYAGSSNLLLNVLQKWIAH